MQSAQVQINSQDGPWNKRFDPMFVWNYSPSGRYGLALYSSLMPYAYVYDALTETYSKYEVVVAVSWTDMITSYWVDDKAIVIVDFDATTHELCRYLAEVKHDKKTIECSFERIYDLHVDIVCTRMTGTRYPLVIGHSEYLPLIVGRNAEPTKAIVVLLNYNPLCLSKRVMTFIFESADYMPPSAGAGAYFCWAKMSVLDDRLICPIVDPNEPNPKAVRFLVMDIGRVLASSKHATVHPLNPEYKMVGRTVQILNFKFPNNEPVESLTNEMSYSLYGSKMLCWDSESNGGVCNVFVADLYSAKGVVIRLDAPRWCYFVSVSLDRIGRLEMWSHCLDPGNPPKLMLSKKSAVELVDEPPSLQDLCRARLLERDAVHLLSEEVVERFMF